MAAQDKTISPVGTYYIEGVREVASGFKLNEDSTFEFFFSYGALDRTGTGRWKVNGTQIEFTTDKKPSPAFTMVKSEFMEELPGTMVKVNTTPAYLGMYMHARFTVGGQSELASANSHGIIQSKLKHPDTIHLVFEFCTDKIFEWVVGDSTHNYFEFRMEPGVAEVIFDHFQLQWVDGKLKGPHPLMKEKQFVYARAGH